ncbi:hypothetical protein [Virgisporangium ochraceum]|uniref:Uncharacterized protein n=1 Tax=Virgisporangium ochraceum TaxID=65505 RepID=A0A8J4A517_9ACTN|nr:hypothetical protein [Virgisporangium ochraceum]GIJ73980.1 hypothetical protein Voc01_088970 [Virgisporangium ochraceum]
MNTRFPDLDRGLHALAADVPASAPPTDRLLDRGRRLRRRRTMATVGSACAVLVLAGVAVAVTAPATTAPDGRDRGTAATSPRLDPVAAVTATERTSYTYTMNYRAVPIDGVARTPADEELLANYGGAGHDFLGAFDPATSTGFHRDPREFGSERRLIDGVMFDGKGGYWTELPGRYTGLRVGVPGMGTFSATTTELLRLLREQGAEVTGAGPYTFEMVVPPAPAEGRFPGGTAAVSVTGTVTLTDDGRFVRTLRFSSTHPEPQWVQGVRIEVTYTFADHGAPVVVERPPTGR